MSGNIVNTNLRLNLDNAEDRRAWERLRRMDRTRHKSYSKAVVAALNEFFDRQERLANDPYLETREKENAFLKRVLDTVERGLRSTSPRPQTLSVAPTPDNVKAKLDSANDSQTPNSAEEAEGMRKLAKYSQHNSMRKAPCMITMQ